MEATASASFNVTFGKGHYGTTACTFTEVPVGLVACSGRGPERKAIPVGYKFRWSWTSKDAYVDGEFSQTACGNPLVHLTCTNAAKSQSTQASGDSPTAAINKLLSEMRSAGWKIGESTRLNAWGVMGLDLTSPCMAFMKANSFPLVSVSTLPCSN